MGHKTDRIDLGTATDRELRRAMTRRTVHDLICGKTEIECHKIIFDLRRVPAVPNDELMNDKIAAVQEWIDEGEFWTSNSQVEDRIEQERTNR